MELRAIHQIEITSRCNLRCRYCVHPTMPRAKQDMTDAVFARAVGLAHQLSRKYGHHELNLAGIGESTMHPQFLLYLSMARKIMPAEISIVLATNGLLIDRHLAEAMAAIRDAHGIVKVWVSLHRPEKAGRAVEELRRLGLLFGVSTDPATASVNWAGQIDWPVSTQVRTPCPWLRGGLGMVASDGSVLQCCFDGSGVSRLGDIFDPVETIETRPHEMCEKCHHTVPHQE